MVWFKGPMRAAIFLCVAACQPDTPKQDVTFVEGCWVLRWNSDQSVSMRTHISLDRDGTTFRGVVREFGDVNDPGQDSYEFIFARDGSWLDMDNRAPDSVRRISSAPRPRLIAAMLPPEIAANFSESDQMAVFRIEGGDWVTVSRMADQLGAALVHADGQPGQTYFAGKREACE